MDIWEHSIASLLVITRFCLSIFKKLLLPQRFSSIFTSVFFITTNTVPENKSKFSHFPEKHWVVSFMAYALLFAWVYWVYQIMTLCIIMAPQKYKGELGPFVFPFKLTFLRLKDNT